MKLYAFVLSWVPFILSPAFAFNGNNLFDRLIGTYTLVEGQDKNCSQKINMREVPPDIESYRGRRMMLEIDAQDPLAFKRFFPPGIKVSERDDDIGYEFITKIKENVIYSDSRRWKWRVPFLIKRYSRWEHEASLTIGEGFVSIYIYKGKTYGGLGGFPENVSCTYQADGFEV